MKHNKIDIESLERKKIHKVPEGYFDHLPLKIQSRINEEKEFSSPMLISRMQLFWSMTAAVTIFLIGWIIYPESNDLSTTDQLLAEIASEDLIEYLYEEDISTDDIIASINEEYLIEEMSTIETEMIDSELSDEDLESIYLEMDYSTEIM